MSSQIELVEQDSESCPVEATGSGGIPLILLLAVGAVMVVGIVYMGGEKATVKPGGKTAENHGGTI
jgi:hypothetical protein